MTDRPFLPSGSGTDVRVEPRTPVRWRGQVLTADGRRLAVQVVDISASGAGFVGDDTLALHQAITLEAQVPRLPDMIGHVVERWQATLAFQMFKGGALRSGVKFDALTPEQQAHLLAWTSRRAHRL